MAGACGAGVLCADLGTGEPHGPLLVHPGKVWAIHPAVLGGAEVVATGCADRTVRIWDIASGRTIRSVALPQIPTGSSR